MRTSDLLDAPSPLGLLGSGLATAALSMPPVDLSAYSQLSQLVQHMASLYHCDPAEVAASLATITSSASHLPLAVTPPHALTTVALATAALSADSRNANRSSLGQLSDTTTKAGDSSTIHVKNKLSRNMEIQSFINQTNGFDSNRNSISSMHFHNSSDKNKKQKSNSKNPVQQDSDGALDLSTQGLRSLYSSYRRINLDKLKPKVVEDVWVENDSVLSWTNSKVAAYNPAQKLFMCVDCECVGFLSRVAEHWLGAHANLRVFRCPRCPYTSAWSRCVKMHLTRQHNEQCADTTMWKGNATLMEVTRLMQELRTKVETRIDSSSTLTDKRFYCPHCPYATDRRDLYTRHENIHKDDKPFHCYLCFKQFNRADHVKKHFVRMHPDTQYDIGKIRKQPGVRGRGSPMAHEPTPPPPPPTSSVPKIIVIPSISSNISPRTSPSKKNRPRSLSPLPLTIQNLRAHNMTMNHAAHLLSPPSPEITVDVVTPDPLPQSISCHSPPLIDILPLQLPVSQPNSITITKCSPPISVSSQSQPISLPQTIPLMIPTVSPEPKSPESAGLCVSDSNDQNRCKKQRSDRAFLCPYCQWSGSDNWCLKRHMNTHIKPFACSMCEYKAARAERLSTHVLKVHNMRICNKCNFLADTQEKLLEHTREEHHNNPYSRRHTCGICGITLENQSALQVHLQKAHAPQNQPATSSAPISPLLSPSVEPEHQDEAQDLSVCTPITDNLEEGNIPLVCPVETCPIKFNDSNALAVHLQSCHSNKSVSCCPHCSFSLTKDELAKDHWLTHHQEVCAACVHVFTAIFGAQLWKKVHAKQSCPDTSLDTIVSGLSRKRSAPCSLNDSLSESDNCESVSAESDHHESDNERHYKRSRKQSCPKKVIAVAEDGSDEELSDFEDVESDDQTNSKSLEQKRRKSRRCLQCPHRPVFATNAKLRIHRRNRHRTVKPASNLLAVGKAVIITPN